jgi:hypothetical protein
MFEDGIITKKKDLSLVSGNGADYMGPWEWLLCHVCLHVPECNSQHISCRKPRTRACGSGGSHEGLHPWGHFARRCLHGVFGFRLGPWVHPLDVAFCFGVGLVPGLGLIERGPSGSMPHSPRTILHTKTKFDGLSIRALSFSLCGSRLFADSNSGIPRANPS